MATLKIPNRRIKTSPSKLENEFRFFLEINDVGSAQENDLIEELEVSPRTLFRYAGDLRLCGLKYLKYEKRSSSVFCYKDPEDLDRTYDSYDYCGGNDPHLLRLHRLICIYCTFENEFIRYIDRIRYPEDHEDYEDVPEKVSARRVADALKALGFSPVPSIRTLERDLKIIQDEANCYYGKI